MGAAEPARLKITEVFLSLQGETSLAGWPTVFIRLTGCPLRCQYCDTAYAFHGGQWRTLDQLLEERSEEQRLNSSHSSISYAVFCLKKKKNTRKRQRHHC